MTNCFGLGAMDTAEDIVSPTASVGRCDTGGKADSFDGPQEGLAEVFWILVCFWMRTCLRSFCRRRTSFAQTCFWRFNSRRIACPSKFFLIAICNSSCCCDCDALLTAGEDEAHCSPPHPSCSAVNIARFAGVLVLIAGSPGRGGR